MGNQCKKPIGKFRKLKTDFASETLNQLNFFDLSLKDYNLAQELLKS